MSTFLEEIKNIQKSNNLNDKKDISLKLFDYLVEDPSKAESLLRIVFSPLLASSKVLLLSKMLRSREAIMNIKEYIDSDYKTKTRLIITIIPPMDNNNEKFENDILLELVSQIKVNNLDFVINDVTVNTLQWRSKFIWEE